MFNQLNQNPYNLWQSRKLVVASSATAQITLLSHTYLPQTQPLLLRESQKWESAFIQKFVLIARVFFFVIQDCGVQMLKGSNLKNLKRCNLKATLTVVHFDYNAENPRYVRSVAWVAWLPELKRRKWVLPAQQQIHHRTRSRLWDAWSKMSSLQFPGNCAAAMCPGTRRLYHLAAPARPAWTPFRLPRPSSSVAIGPAGGLAGGAACATPAWWVLLISMSGMAPFCSCWVPWLRICIEGRLPWRSSLGMLLA